MRTAGSAFFVLLALVLGAVALPSAWLASSVVSEAGFVELASPLAGDAEFTGALAEALSEDAAAGADLPSGVAGAVQPLVRDVALSIAELPGFASAWQETLRRSHALTFAAEDQSPNDGVPPAIFTLDLAPLVALVTSEIGGQLGVEVPAPEQTPVEVGGADRFDTVNRVGAAADFWPVLSIAAAVCAVISFALARRRSTTVALLGLGVLLVGAGLWLAAAVGPGLVDQLAADVAVADVFKDAVVARAAEDFQEWTLAALAAGILLLVAGVVGLLLSGSRR